MNAPEHAAPVVRASAAHLAAITAVLVRAFCTDPLFTYALPDAAHRARALPALLGAAARYTIECGEAYVSGEPPDGVALWLLPAGGAPQPDGLGATEEPKVAGLLGKESLARLGAAVRHLEWQRSRWRPEAHWYLSLIAVDPVTQGRGTGSALLGAMLARADAARADCYLETLEARNLPFYTRHAFEVVAEGCLPAGGPRYWAMLRHSRKHRSDAARRDSASAPAIISPRVQPTGSHPGT